MGGDTPEGGGEYRVRHSSYPVIDIKRTGENIRRIRGERNLTLDDVREFLGELTVHRIQLWEKGVLLPGVEHLCALSKLFGVLMDDIIILHDYHSPGHFFEIGICLRGYTGNLGLVTS